MNSKARELALEALDELAEAASASARGAGPEAAIGLLAVAAVAKGVSTAMRLHGVDVDDILAQIREPRKLTLPWNESP